MPFLDRSNIGNAKLQGLEDSLDMKGQDYSIALFLFFVTYILCEVISNLILKKLRPPSQPRHRLSSIPIQGVSSLCVHRY